MQGIPDDEDEIVTDPSAAHLVILMTCLEIKMKKKLSYGLQEKDIIELQAWCTSHKIYFNNVNLLAPSV